MHFTGFDSVECTPTSTGGVLASGGSVRAAGRHAVAEVRWVNYDGEDDTEREACRRVP